MSDDPVLLITGASSGIGAATSRRAAEAGYRVVLGARRKTELDKLARELGGADRALARRCDVTNWTDVEGLVEATMARFGRIDAVFANAGFGAARGFLEESPEQWRAMIDLITGSVAGRRVLPGSLYSATKWAVGAIAEALRQELRQMHDNTGIRVTLIEPGMTDTDFFDNRPRKALADDDIARAVLWALEQPESVDVNEILIRPTSQPS
jgi:NADP-dependent 3-hydroxy acid dehydrogenase YdfG